VASVQEYSDTLFVGMLNFSLLPVQWTNHSVSSDFFFEMQLALEPYCQANIIRDGLVWFADPVEFYTDDYSRNVTVYPRQFDAYALSGGVSTGYGESAYLHAFVLPDVQENQSVPVVVKASLTDDVITDLLIQQRTDVPTGEQRMLTLRAPAEVVSWINGSASLIAQVNWDQRRLLDAQAAGIQLNKSPYYVLKSLSYQPDDTITLTGIAPADLNLTEAALSNLSFIESVKESGGDVVVSVGNRSDAPAIINAITNATGVIPSDMLLLPSKALMQVTLPDNASLESVQQYILASLPVAGALSLEQPATVELISGPQASRVAGVVLPARFSALVDPTKVVAGNLTQLSITINAEGTRLVSMYAESTQ
jgi:hypothetical protein